MRLPVTLVVLVALLSFTAIVAQQTSTPEPEQVLEVSCEPEDIAAAQLELNATLETLEADLNTDADVGLGALYEVGLRYQEIALHCGYIPPNAGELMVGTDVDQILEVLATLHGDPINGQLIYNSIDPGADGGQLGCSGCHSEPEIAPPTSGTWTRWDETYSKLDQFENYDFEHYVVESVIHPGAFIVPDYKSGTMPQNFGDRLNFQNLADVVAYLETQDQLTDE
jgi:hypothetical protein